MTLRYTFTSEMASKGTGWYLEVFRFGDASKALQGTLKIEQGTSLPPDAGRWSRKLEINEHDYSSLVTSEPGMRCTIERRDRDKLWDVSAAGGLINKSSEILQVHCPIRVLDFVMLPGWADTGNPFDQHDRKVVMVQSFPGIDCKTAQVRVRVLNNAASGEFRCRIHASGGEDQNGDGTFDWQSTPQTNSARRGVPETLVLDLKSTLAADHSHYLFFSCTMPPKGERPSQLLGYQVIFDRCR